MNIRNPLRSFFLKPVNPEAQYNDMPQLMPIDENEMLISAIKEGNSNMVNVLLDQKADANTISSGSPALYIATQHHHLDIVKSAPTILLTQFEHFTFFRQENIHHLISEVDDHYVGLSARFPTLK